MELKSTLDKIYSNILKRIKSDPINDKSNLQRNFPKVGFLSLEMKTKLEQITGTKIKNTSYYEQALTHRSYQHVYGFEIQSNERMEFLGDAVLEMAISNYLFMEHSDESEGELTKMRSWLVNRRSLAAAAAFLNLEELVMLSYSAEKAMHKGSKSIMADALEALIAAVYLDCGYANAEKFILEKLLPIILEMGMMNDNNYKSILLEKVQSYGFKAPIYELIEADGPDHSKTFKIAVVVNGDKIAEGIGKSKKEAEQKAAKQALNQSLFLNQ